MATIKKYKNFTYQGKKFSWRLVINGQSISPGGNVVESLSYITIQSYKKEPVRALVNIDKNNRKIRKMIHWLDDSRYDLALPRRIKILAAIRHYAINHRQAKIIELYQLYKFGLKIIESKQPYKLFEQSKLYKEMSTAKNSYHLNNLLFRIWQEK